MCLVSLFPVPGPPWDSRGRRPWEWTLEVSVSCLEDLQVYPCPAE